MRRPLAAALAALALLHPSHATAPAAPLRVTVALPRLTQPAPAAMQRPMPAALRPLASYLPLFRRYPRRAGIPASLAEAVALVESDGHPWAVSAEGAVGLLQVLPRTAHSLGVWGLRSPVASIVAGTRYLRWLGHLYGVRPSCWRVSPGGDAACAWRVDRVLSAYNSGPRGAYQARYVADVRARWVAVRGGAAA